MKIAIGSDHAGFALKQHLLAHLRAKGHAVIDVGCDSEASVDYPAYCAAVGRAVVRGVVERGVVIGGSGQGEQLAANKIRGIRAALANDLFLARVARQHNDANVLSLGGRVIAPALATEIVDLFLAVEFEGGRHVRRLEQLAAIETAPVEQIDAYLDSLAPGITARASGT